MESALAYEETEEEGCGGLSVDGGFGRNVAGGRAGHDGVEKCAQSVHRTCLWCESQISNFYVGI
jgi:hypothetical protein